MFRIESATGTSGFRVFVLDVMRLVFDGNKSQLGLCSLVSPRTTRHHLTRNRASFFSFGLPDFFLPAIVRPKFSADESEPESE